MARLAFPDLRNVVVDDRETRRRGPSYTVDTLTELAAEQPGVQLFLIIGEDQAKSLQSWHRWQAILQLAIICVAARADSSGARGTFNAELLAQTPFQVLNLPPMDVSATTSRHWFLKPLRVILPTTTFIKLPDEQTNCCQKRH